jgi:hypothetical protein
VSGGELTETTVRFLRRQGLMEFEQLRPVEEEPVRVLGGRPFAAFELRAQAAACPGLEGALLGAGRQATGSDVRSLVRALDLDNRSLTNAVMSDCLRAVADAYSLDLGD